MSAMSFIGPDRPVASGPIRLAPLQKGGDAPAETRVISPRFEPITANVLPDRLRMMAKASRPNTKLSEREL